MLCILTTKANICFVETKWVNPGEADLDTGRREWIPVADEEERTGGWFKRVKTAFIG